MWKNIEIKNNTTGTFIFRESGDLRNKNFIFAVKSIKSPSVIADILKKNLSNGGSDTEIYVSYNPAKDESEIKVFVLPADTINLGGSTFFYSLKNETNNIEYFYGKFHIIAGIYGTSTNYAGNFRYYVGSNIERDSLALSLSSSDEGLVWFYSTTDDSLYVWSGTNFV